MKSSEEVSDGGEGEAVKWWLMVVRGRQWSGDWWWEGRSSEVMSDGGEVEAVSDGGELEAVKWWVIVVSWRQWSDEWWWWCGGSEGTMEDAQDC